MKLTACTIISKPQNTGLLVNQKEVIAASKRSRRAGGLRGGGRAARWAGNAAGEQVGRRVVPVAACFPHSCSPCENRAVTPDGHTCPIDFEAAETVDYKTRLPRIKCKSGAKTLRLELPRSRASCSKLHQLRSFSRSFSGSSCPAADRSAARARRGARKSVTDSHTCAARLPLP